MINKLRNLMVRYNYLEATNMHPFILDSKTKENESVRIADLVSYIQSLQHDRDFLIKSNQELSNEIHLLKNEIQTLQRALHIGSEEYRIAMHLVPFVDDWEDVWRDKAEKEILERQKSK